jgi:hypothetical protein
MPTGKAKRETKFSIPNSHLTEESKRLVQEWKNSRLALIGMSAGTAGATALPVPGVAAALTPILLRTYKKFKQRSQLVAEEGFSNGFIAEEYAEKYPWLKRRKFGAIELTPGRMRFVGWKVAVHQLENEKTLKGMLTDLVTKRNGRVSFRQLQRKLYPWAYHPELLKQRAKR